MCVRRASFADRLSRHFATNLGITGVDLCDRVRHARSGYSMARVVACPSCGCGPVGFMVRDEVWLAAGLPTGARRAGWWCRECFEARLGRPLVSGDLIACPMSDWLFIELMD
jgi:hypothetical protein